MRLDSFTFDGSGTDKWVLPGGNFLMLVSTSAVVSVKYLKHGQVLTDETATDVEEGYYTTPERQGAGDAFDTVEITSASAQTVKTFISRGNGGLNQTFGSIDATVVAGTTIPSTQDQTVADTTGAGVPTEILAANADRKEVMVRSLSTNTAAVRIGGSDIDTDHGQPLEVNEQITIAATAAIYIWNESGANQIFAITEIVK